MNELDGALRFLGVACEVTLLFLLLKRGLWSRYKWFGTYLALDCLQTVALLPFRWDDPRYCLGWGVSEICVLIALGGGALEAARKLWAHCPELGIYARFVFALCLVLCFAIGAAAALVEIQGTPPRNAFMGLMLGALRSVSWMVVVFLLAQGLCFSIFEIPMRANVRWHRWMLILYGGMVPGFGGFLVEQFARNGSFHAAGITNLVMMTVNVVCLLVWSFVLTPQGEIIASSTPIRRDDLNRSKPSEELARAATLSWS